MRKIFGGNDPEPRRRDDAAAKPDAERSGTVQRRSTSSADTAGESQPQSLQPPQAPRVVQGELTSELTLVRIEDRLMLTGYSVKRHQDENTSHDFLTGTWEDFPFVIEIPDEHPGWLLISADQREPISSGQREEVSASVNDWNRDKFFPTVAISEMGDGPHVRAVYLMDLTMGVTDSQLAMHIDTALAACVQALQNVVPILPEF